MRIGRGFDAHRFASHDCRQAVMGLPVCVGMVTASKVIRTVMSQPMR